MNLPSFETAKTIATLAGVFLAAIGLLLNAYATFKSVRSRKLLNYQEIVKSHRELWKLALDNPQKFARVLALDADLKTTPLTQEEKRFGNLLFLHSSSAFYFCVHSDIIQIAKLKQDVGELMQYQSRKHVGVNMHATSMTILLNSWSNPTKRLEPDKNFSRVLNYCLCGKRQFVTSGLA